MTTHAHSEGASRTMNAVHTVEAARIDGAEPELIWYTSYGSNMHLDRLASYIAGGAPPGAARRYPGCRDRRPPVRSVPVELQGRLYFATESPVWTGGRGFYDPAASGRTRARAHLVTAQQFSDIAAQEMYREPGSDFDLAEVLRSGRDELGPGRYETLICSGVLERIPVLTFTAPWGVREVEWVKPSAAYVKYLAAGMSESGAWDERSIADYLSECPGAAGHWSADQIVVLLAST
ncbi:MULTISPECIES: histone deacetylase [unclassified Streptomyces]|uniref:histone deacetylase n=1 Tax=unclassified Streptomyces TaxID=2593676 RepID=UPI002E2A8DCA|nr:histone deacetylase [Streptomyces sp. NBC_00190]